MVSSSKPRSDGQTYIGEPPTIEDGTASSSGSSVEEELEEGGNGAVVWDNEGQPEASTSGTSGVESEEYLDDEGDWEVGDEDWELAQGDFTKHYNRVRQQRAALSATPSQTTASRPPLPSRNPHPPNPNTQTNTSTQTTRTNVTSVPSGGFAINPKASLDRHEKDKKDRATQEQVLDNRTRLVLSGLINRGILGKLDHCISTGKEANVYLSKAFATDQTLVSRAVKIYRTSILNFRSRQAYIVGEHRFRGEYSSSRNPRKMIRVWAEKELRNLRRLQQGGVRSPEVFECKENVLVMEFLGTNGTASPRLKDADIAEDELPILYGEMIVCMRRMYHNCHLVHADLSEYNILYHQSHLFIIDVSQSVEHDHPRSFDFLRNDIRNIKDFFSRRFNGNWPMLSLRRTWDFIINPQIDTLTLEDECGDQGEIQLLAALENWIENQVKDASMSTDDDDAVFMSSFIPKSLSEIPDPEREVELLNSGASQLVYADLTESTNKSNVSAETQELAEKTESIDLESDDGDGQVDPEDADASKQLDDTQDVSQDRRPRGFRHEDKDEKKDRKKAIKEEQRQRRQTKMSKTEKQRLVKKSAK